MPVLRLLCSAFLAAAPLATLAQSTDPDPAPTYRFYGGLAAFTSGAQSLGRFYGSRYNVPVQLTVGYQLRPRLAVQGGLAYSSTKSGNSYTQAYVDASSNLVSYLNTTTYEQRAVSASVLARYTLTRKATHRFQVDALGGPSFEHFAGRSTYSETATTQGSSSVSNYDYSYSYNDLLFNVGPSFRYRFGKHLEAVYDVLYNVALTRHFYGDAAMALGLRYRFGPS